MFRAARSKGRCEPLRRGFLNSPITRGRGEAMEYAKSPQQCAALIGRGLKLFALVSALGATVTVAACTYEARVFPIDPAAMAAGVPKIEFVRQGSQHGPVTVTMPDGEILKGEFQVTENASIGMGFAGAQTFSAIGFGSGRPVVVSATGDHTIINCEGTADIGSHGSVMCQTSQGNKYRVMF